MDVSEWLKALGFAEYADVFDQNGVDGSLLAELTNEDLKDLGVAKLADRRAILKAIAHLSDERVCRQESLRNTFAGERRQVTVLFADLTNFTRLSTKIGAEETHAILNRYFELVDRIIESYGGRVDKHIGDNAMAVFGAPTAHDDDSLRAVLAAVEIHEKMTSLPAHSGEFLQAHIGIASGQVVASATGSVAHHEYTVTGEAVNLASRLQGQAGPGETLVSDSLFRTVTDRVDCEALGEIIIKGLDAPVRVWRVRSLYRAGHGRARAGFVGRQAELAQFSGVAEACRSAGIGQTIIVRGEAGIGKTRLVEEFSRIAADKEFSIHKGLVLDFGVGKGQDAIRSVVHSFLGVGLGAARMVRQAAAEGAIAEGSLTAEQRPFLNDLLELPQAIEEHAIYEAMSNTKRNEGKREVVSRLIQTSSERRPVLIVIEDAHWADPLMLMHFAKMAATIADCQALLVMTSRIEGDPFDQAWRATIEGCPLMSMHVAPLRKKDALALAGAFIDANHQFALDCVERAEGNPLFLEQLLRDAKERGEEEIPASIQSLVLSRMDRLSPMDKRALQAASVIGQRFALDTLRHLIDADGYVCNELIRHHLVRPEGEYFLFAHALIQEGVYSSLLKSARRDLHIRAAAWFADYDSTLKAQHLDRASDPGAVRAYIEASQTQAHGYHFEKALALAKRGLVLANDGAERFAAAIHLGELLHDTGEPQGSIAQFETALGLATTDRERCQALIGLAAGYRIVDRTEDALAALAEAEPMAEYAQQALDLARIHHLRGNLYFPLGKLEGCLSEHEKALKFAELCGSAHYKARALGGLGDAYYALGRMETAHGYFEGCIDLCRVNGFGSIEVAYLTMKFDTHFFRGDLSKVFADCHKAIELATRVGNRRAEFFSHWNHVFYSLELHCGADAAAKRSLATARNIVEQLGLRRCEPFVIIASCTLAIFERQPIDVDAELRRAYAICQETGMTFAGPWVLGILAFSTKDPETRDWALREGQRALTEQICVSHNYIYFYRYAMDASISAGLWAEAERYALELEEYTRPEPLPVCDFFIARARALSDWGRGKRDGVLVMELRRLANEAKRMGLNSDLPVLQEALDVAGQRRQTVSVPK
jgi:class 3 adenylate cyclase/tetratricopeptide (TPR) repeat protein